MEVRHLLLLLFVAITFADEFHPHSVAPRFPVVNVMEASRTFWRNRAAQYITGKLDQPHNTKKAKNVILFIGDGMSIPTVSAARMYDGKEEAELSFEKFPHYGLAKTYCLDMTVGDSACTAVAFLAGVKTNNRLLGINGNVLSRQCEVNQDDHIENIVHWAQKAEKATGIVTTTRITHATPAAAYAHVAHRDWEHNNAITTACRGIENVTDISHQLVYNEVAKNLKVILGGGRRGFRGTTVRDEEGNTGLRTDGRDLIEEWIEERSKQGDAKYVWHNQQLKEVNVEETDYLLGLFESDHCMFTLSIKDNGLGYQEPTLSEMTVKAIKMLQKEENGFFLLVEGGRIDHAHHSNTPHRAMEDTKELARAIEIARELTDVEDTLIVVSSDHSHSFSYNGYPDRGKHINGAWERSSLDQKVYDTLSYANGPGYPQTFANGERIDLSRVDLKNPARRASATVPLSSETHAGEDVGVYASGPWSHLFTGTYEQNNIPILMSYAAQIGPYGNSGEGETTDTSEDTTTDSAGIAVTSVFVLLTTLVASLSNQFMNIC